MKIRVKYRNRINEIVAGEYEAVICDNTQGLCGLRCFDDTSDVGTYNYTFIDSEEIIHVCAILPDNI